ncbi:TIGR00730 family Rossman fold protein [Psychrobacter alimentarius]|uniref:Cytokinin riboside 5'-monophosphate phosphoribohydrolase n=1 Tax=Psychrobacter alimentarius TaxID=261164 RepID=A0ABN4N618_9GAMM|nr:MULTISPECIES: TIGR00730 family Rossman fold protein [Psychrobacter]AMT98033.1 Lysine decarboxylase family [Psychrobacter alimentarius]PAT62695.1 TIGR00730 family Rossman fold protein [Psychrobacter sp. JB193]QCB29696.1 TIGR00730 family Rossman fold protein [Psychrobacter sp. PAMC27889]
MQMNINNDTYEVITSQDIHNIEQAVDKSALSMPLVAVYCGSRLGNSEVYEQAARELGLALAENGLGLVYGGASIGLMGAVADEVIQNGAQAVGVIPTFMLKHEIAHEQLTRLHLTDTMHTRKTVMAEYADAFITLPGGLGTLEEIMEIATWRQLYQHEKPMIILNINGFYDRMIEHLKHTTEQGFMKQEDLDRLVVCNTIGDAIDLLKTVVKIHDEVDTEKMAGSES